MKTKSNFTRPLAQNSFKKSQRKYPQPKDVKKNIQRQQVNMLQQGQNPVVQKRTHVLTNTAKISRYHFVNATPFPIYNNGQTNPFIDQSCIWYKKLPNNVTGEKQRKIKFNKIDYTISNWSQDEFYSVIYICIQGFAGFLNQFGEVTQRVTALQLSSISGVYQSTGAKNHDIYYQSRQIQWLIPNQMTFLKLYISFGNNYEAFQLPLITPLTIDIQLKYQ